MGIRHIFLGAALAVAGALSGATAFAGETLDQIMSSNTLKVATDPNWAPQSFLNDNNEMDGFDVDVAREIASRMGVEVEFVTPSWDIITAGNWNGRWHLSVGSMTPTTARGEILDFPGVYYYTPASAVVHNDSPYKNVADLNGAKMAAGISTTFELYLQKDLTIDASGVPTFEYQITPGEYRSYETGAVALDDLRLGDGVRLNGVVGSLPAMLKAIENGYPIRVLGEPLFYEPLAIATDKGDAELNAKLSAIVDEMRNDGTLKTLSEKWYGIDYTTALN